MTLSRLNDSGKMEAVEVIFSPSGPEFQASDQTPQGYIVPGFIDVHIHGAFGIDFMECEPGQMKVWASKLAQIGYEAFLPTTITSDVDSVLWAIGKLEPSPETPYFHLEGPFISPKHPGAQPPSAILPVPSSDSPWHEVLSHPRLKVITLAPELEGAPELIAKLTAAGVRVSIGHTDATYEQAKKSSEFGACSCTHTFNAMRGFHHREAGTVGFALNNDKVYTELIYDRVHVSREAAATLIKCKPSDRIIAISDCTKAAGLPAGTSLTMWGLSVVVGENNVRLAASNTLAGSTSTLADIFKFIAEDFGIENAIRFCCLNPRTYIGLTGAPRVWLQLDHHFEVVKVHTRTASDA